jgi:5-formyltetrahydrofolate cyclo-ligase
MSIDGEKLKLRVQAKLSRAKAHNALANEGAAAISATGLSFLTPATNLIVSGYAAMPGELDAGPLLARLHEEGFDLALPVTIGRGKPLVFRIWRPGDAMGAGFQGIAEPLPSAPEAAPDIVLLPLLAFDDAGYRLGYGGGHYDRSLAKLRAQQRVIAVGLAYDEQKVDAVPHDRYDQRLDWILTPSGARAFKES